MLGCRRNSERAAAALRAVATVSVAPRRDRVCNGGAPPAGAARGAARGLGRAAVRVGAAAARGGEVRALHEAIIARLRFVSRLHGI